jgi:hypothetical protein
MMNKSALLFALALQMLCSTSYAEDIRSCVKIEVRGPQGEPLADVPVQCVWAHGFPMTFTDQQGVAEFSILRERRQERIGWVLSDGFLAPLAAEKIQHASERYVQLLTQFAFPPFQVGTIPADAVNATFTLVADDAVTVQGVVMTPGGAPLVGAAVMVAKTHSLTKADLQGAFKCRGVPKARDAILQVMGKGSRAWAVPLGSRQLATNADLGEIVLDTEAEGAHARLKWPGHRPMTSADMDSVGGEVSLIRTDGEVIHVFEIDERSGAVGTGGTNIGENQVVPLSPGCYYVAPGMIGSTPSLKLLDLIRGGRLVDLNKASVPKFTAVEGETVEFSFDLAAALAAIESIPDQPLVLNPTRTPQTPSP